MARTVEEIKASIQTEIRSSYPNLNNFLFPEEGGSAVAIHNAIIYVVSLAIYTFEVLNDVATSRLETLRNESISGNKAWVRNRILEFQYGDVITFVDNVPSYDPVDESARIITQCSVKEVIQGSSAFIQIKVAKNDPPEPLDAGELSALQDYYYGTPTTEGVGFAGVRAQFINLESDRMRVEATIYYLGQYVEATVKAAVITAIDDFFASFTDSSFDGTIFMNRLVDAIQAVPGVSRVQLDDVKARAETVALGSATPIDIQGYYLTVAGHIISEDTAGNTLADTITMEQESA